MTAGATVFTAFVLGLAPVAVKAETPSAAIFALIDGNEWCPGGSVYLDLQTGSYVLYPRLSRPTCRDIESKTAVERGSLGPQSLERLRVAYAETRRVGLRREACDERWISNGGPETLVITAPAYSETT